MSPSLTLEGSYRAQKKLILQELEKIETDTQDPLAYDADKNLENGPNDDQEQSLSSLLQFYVCTPDSIQSGERRPGIRHSSVARGPRKQKNSKGSDNESNVKTSMLQNSPSDGKKMLEVVHYRTPLPGLLHQGCMDLFVDNMSEHYKNSSWGLDLESKSKELKHRRAQFLLLAEKGTLNNNDNEKRRCSKRTSKSRGGKDVTETRKPNPVLAFLHYRYELDENFNPDHPYPELILYIYELQISKMLQRSGVGRRLMSIVEAIAKQRNQRNLLSSKSSEKSKKFSSSQIRNIVLTVFTHNKAALSFYKNKLHFHVAPCSPSYPGVEQLSSPSKNTRQKKNTPPEPLNATEEDNDCPTDYEILFKAVS